MTVPRALRPVTSGQTLRRGVLLVIGGVLAAAYGLLVQGYAQMYATPDVPAAVVTVLVAVTAAIVLAPPFLHPVRVVGALGARALLDADLPVLPGRGVNACLRGALWYLVHLVGGAVAVLALVVCVPLAVTLGARHAGLMVLDAALGPLRSLPAAPALAVAVVAVAVPAYVVWWLGALLRRLAPMLLGPSAQDRITRLEAEKRELAARNALARDLHDSVGHALTVTALQAAAAERALDRDTAFVRTALAAIATTGRDAAAELDRALGLLRSGAAPSAADAAAGDRTLADIPALVQDLRAAGTEVTLSFPPGTQGVPQLVSRACYAVAREATTNALRHGDGAIELSVQLDGGDVVLTVGNRLPDARPRRAGGTGRGLAGMRERVDALGGEMTWGVERGRWVVRARVPGEVP